jgi:O-antigen ligase
LLPITQVSEKDRVAQRENSALKRGSALVGVFLFLLLIFITVTVWVRQAWALQIFQIGIYGLVAVQVLSGVGRDREDIARGLIPWMVYLIPIWGMIQILAHTTTSTIDTREQLLRWGALSGVFYLSQVVTRSQTSRQQFLSAFLCFATGMAVLFLIQYNTSEGRILWVFPTGFSQIFGTFQNRNNYAQFVELALPIALWGAVREGWCSWWYAVAGGVLYASAIGAASRAGFVLCTVELIAVLMIGLIRIQRRGAMLSSRPATTILLIVPVVAGAFTFAVGWDRVLARFKEDDPFAIRREFFIGAVDMTKHRPLTGYGLGTFEQVYQQYAIKDFAFYANHAHDDWAEFAAEGGIPFLLLVAIPFFSAVPTAFRHPWGLGVLATMLNACVDYPFPRPAVSGWMFAILAALYMTRKSERSPS